MKIVDKGYRNFRFLTTTSSMDLQVWTLAKDKPLLESDGTDWQGVKLEGSLGKKIILSHDELDDLVDMGLINKEGKEFDYPENGVSFEIKKGLLKK